MIISTWIFCNKKFLNSILCNNILFLKCYIPELPMTINIRTKDGQYPVFLERRALSRAAELSAAGGRAFIVSDSGVPACWKDVLREQFPDASWFVFPQGEVSKSPDTYKDLIFEMLKAQVSRKDTMIALGGGVAGDLAGFAAATYMRGIRYVNIPTTALSQIDSCIGGKTAIDFGGIKNCIGAFWQPSAVITDPEVLSTLPQRQLSSGLAEAVKAGIIGDPELFELFENSDPKEHLEEIIYRALMVKKAIVEEDETEKGIRKLLNFGHTFGHAYESFYGPDVFLHGECTAMGMMRMTCSAELRERLGKVLKKLDLPTGCDADGEKILKLIANDKKADHGKITAVLADRPGKAYLKDMDIQELEERIRS